MQKMYLDEEAPLLKHPGPILHNRQKDIGSKNKLQYDALQTQWRKKKTMLSPKMSLFGFKMQKQEVRERGSVNMHVGYPGRFDLAEKIQLNSVC